MRRIMIFLFRTFSELWRSTLPRRVQTHDSQYAADIWQVADGETSVPAIIERDLPDEALAQLFALDLPEVAPGPLRFDRGLRQWLPSSEQWKQPLRDSRSSC